jgi:hypothetical protein
MATYFKESIAIGSCTQYRSLSNLSKVDINNNSINFRRFIFQKSFVFRPPHRYQHQSDESYDEFTESISAASEDADDTLKDVEEEEVQEEESEYVASKYRFRDKTKYRH